MSAQTKDQSRPTRTVRIKAKKSSLRISIPSSSLFLDAIQPISNFRVHKSPLAKHFLHDVRNKDRFQAKSEIASPDRFFHINLASLQADGAGDSAMNEDPVPVVSFSSSYSSPHVGFTAPDSHAPQIHD